MQLPKMPNNIKKARIEAGYTDRAAFADKIHKSEETIKKWEMGSNMPDARTLGELADMFHCSVDYLLGRINYKTVGNKFISEATGLTDESIEVLKFLVRFGKRWDNYGANNLAGLNYILGREFPYLPTPEQEEQQSWFDDHIINTVLADIFEYVFCDAVEATASSFEKWKWNQFIRKEMQEAGRPEGEIRKALSPDRLEQVTTLSFEAGEQGGFVQGGDAVIVTVKEIYQQYVFGLLTKRLQSMKDQESKKLKQKKQEGNGNGNME